MRALRFSIGFPPLIARKKVKDFPPLREFTKGAERRLEQVRRAHAEQRHESSEKKKSLVTFLIVGAALVAAAVLRRNPQASVLPFVTLYDIGIACWEAKYTYWAIRPFQLDPDVKPVFATPNHPSYPAAHACASISASRVRASESLPYSTYHAGPSVLRHRSMNP